MFHNFIKRRTSLHIYAAEDQRAMHFLSKDLLFCPFGVVDAREGFDDWKPGYFGLQFIFIDKSSWAYFCSEFNVVLWPFLFPTIYICCALRSDPNHVSVCMHGVVKTVLWFLTCAAFRLERFILISGLYKFQQMMILSRWSTDQITEDSCVSDAETV